jgi:hypothetical protein
LKLKERGQAPGRGFSFKVSSPSVFNRLAFLGAFAVEGMLVVLIGALLMDAQPNWSPVEITAAATGFLSFRRICSLLISPFAGWSADRYGLPSIYSGSIHNHFRKITRMLSPFLYCKVCFTFGLINFTEDERYIQRVCLFL